MMMRSSTAISASAKWGVTMWSLAVAMAAVSSAAPSGQTVKESAPADKPKSGIYFESSEAGGKTELVQLEGAMPSNSVNGAGNPFKKPKLTSTIDGDRASRRLLTAQPVFLFVFGRATREQMMEDPMGAMNALPPMSSNPKDFVLAPLAVKDGVRTVQGGGEPVKLVTEPVSSGVFRVRPEAPLAPGEYGFYFGSKGMQGGIVWDFGIDPAK